MPRGVSKPRYGTSRSGANGGIALHLNWKVTPGAMADSYGAWWEATKVRLVEAMRQVSDEARTYMKVAHPWTNRTGDAEAGLDVQVDIGGDTMMMTLSHGVYYGIYLEYRWGGKWGVIGITIDRYADIAMAAMQDALVG